MYTLLELLFTLKNIFYLKKYKIDVSPTSSSMVNQNHQNRSRMLGKKVLHTWYLKMDSVEFVFLLCYYTPTFRIVGVSRILNIKSKWILVVRVLTFFQSSHFVLNLFVEFIINL